VRKNIVNWEPGGCVPGFCVPNSIKTCKLHTMAAKSFKVTTRMHFMLTKKSIHFDPRNTPAHTVCSQGMLNIP
jgi:hypothetical protein